jgi:putative membrane protein
MTSLFTRLLAVVVALLLASRYIPGIVVDDVYTALIVAAILGVLNLIVRPVLILLTLPITILTLGLFLFVVNALLFWLVGSFVDGFDVTGFVPALMGSLVVSVVSALVQKLSK